MVKFSKELEAQLIPEWKDAFVNYWQLKKHVKKIKISSRKQPNRIQNTTHHFARSIFDPVRNAFKNISDRFSGAGDKAEIIQVKRKITEGENEEGQDDELYETELLNLFSQEDEAKEREFLERGDMLNKQLQILHDLRKVLSDQRRKSRLSKSGAGSFLQSDSGRNSDCSESLNECGESPTQYSETGDTIGAAPEADDADFNIGSQGEKGKRKKHKIMTMKIDIPATTPTRAISAITSMLWEELVLNNPKKESSGDFINKKKIQCAEKMIRRAFVELYRGLVLLKTYSSLNVLAFTKILKKFDKVSHQQTSESYLKAVKRSHFITSDQVIRLMDEVETLFTKHFANNERKKAMKFLRPQQHKDSHMVTFFVGLFTGCFVTLFSVYATLAHACGMFTTGTEAAYMEIVYPVFSMFALLSLHLFMYGCNLFVWRSTRINYNFIFEFQATTALKYRDAFLISTCLMTTMVAAMILHLILLSTGHSPIHADTIPGILLLFFIALLVCPLNVFYRSTRFCFLRVIRNIICSPFYKVLMVDFFMADQLTSQIPLLRHMESTACFFVAGSFKTHRYETCKSGSVYRELAYVVSFTPYYWRAMQCARRWFDEGDMNHVANLGKYVSAMVAAGARLKYTSQPSDLWMAIVLVTSLVATIYQLYWDFVKDWGLLDPKSKNPWLRDDLILKKKSVYYMSIALNFVLRVAWVETVMRFNIGVFQSRLLEFFLASLEVIRRGHWNFYRLENEHLNNVGKFRAVKTVPLPFQLETDSD